MEEYKFLIDFNSESFDRFSYIVVNSEEKNLSHISKCRELLYSNATIIGYPNPIFNNKNFTLIFQTSMFIEKIIQKLEKSGFKVDKKSNVSHQQFITAIMYTIELRISPLWNRVGSVFIEGRDFLSRTGFQCCLEIDITLESHEKLIMKVIPRRINLKKVQLNELGIDTELMKEFAGSLSFTIFSRSIPLRSVYVIPSLKSAFICSIYKGQIPPKTPFLTHLDLQKHWKNQYGYRIPDDKYKVYTELSFLSKSKTSFLYPLECVLSQQPEYMSEPQPHVIVDLFAQQFKYHFPSLCGISLNLKHISQGNLIIQPSVTLNYRQLKENSVKKNTFKSHFIKSFSKHRTNVKHSLSLQIDDNLFDISENLKDEDNKNVERQKVQDEDILNFENYNKSNMTFTCNQERNTDQTSIIYTTNNMTNNLITEENIIIQKTLHLDEESLLTSNCNPYIERTIGEKNVVITSQAMYVDNNNKNLNTFNIPIEDCCMKYASNITARDTNFPKKLHSITQHDSEQRNIHNQNLNDHLQNINTTLNSQRDLLHTTQNANVSMTTSDSFLEAKRKSLKYNKRRGTYDKANYNFKNQVDIKNLNSIKPSNINKINYNCTKLRLGLTKSKIITMKSLRNEE